MTSAEHGPLRKLISFELDGEFYGLDIGDVLEVMPVPVVTPLPRSPLELAGLINLRGEIVGVMDLRPLFRLGQRPLGTDARIAIIEVDQTKAGILAERMWGLHRIPEEAFRPPPGDIPGGGLGYVREVVQVGDRMIAVLDIQRLFAGRIREVDSGIPT